MNKVIVAMMAVLILSVSAAWAQEKNTPGSSQISNGQPIEVGNKICPVTGDKIGSMGPPVKYTYNGRVYNLSCTACIKNFEDNPEKYSKIADDEIASQHK